MIDGHFFNHKGDEFAYVMEGEVEVELEGKSKLLRQGDSLYIESTVPSRWINTGKGRRGPFVGIKSAKRGMVKFK